MRGPTTASGEKRCVPRSEEVVALEKDESFEEVEMSAEEEEELEVEKSMRRACGEGVGGEEVERGDDEEGTAKFRVGTLSDLLLLWGYDLDLDLWSLNMENLNGFRGERIGNAVGGWAVNVGRISRLEERDIRLLVSLSFPTFEEPANTPICGLGIGVGIDFIDVGSNSTPTSPKRPFAPLPLPRSQLY
jgi:hypothetical protein